MRRQADLDFAPEACCGLGNPQCFAALSDSYVGYTEQGCHLNRRQVPDQALQFFAWQRRPLGRTRVFLTSEIFFLLARLLFAFKLRFPLACLFFALPIFLGQYFLDKGIAMGVKDNLHQRVLEKQLYVLIREIADQGANVIQFVVVVG